MTQAELILKLVEKLLDERDRNNNLKSKLEEPKKTKVSLHSQKQESFTGTFLLFLA